MVNSSLLAKLLQYSLPKYYIRAVCIYILYVRGLFTSDNAMSILCYIFIPLVTWTFMGLGRCFDIPLILQMQCLLSIGLNLLAYDKIGSQISTVLLNEEEHPLTLLLMPLLVTGRPKTLRRHIFGTALKGLFIGNGTMTPGGRAVIIASLVTGATLLYNAKLERDAANRRADQDRDAVNERAALDRVAAYIKAHQDRENARYMAEQARKFESYKMSHDAWKQEPPKTRGPEPKWNGEYKK